MRLEEAGWADRAEVEDLLAMARIEHCTVSCNGTWDPLGDAISDVACLRSSEELASAEAEVWWIFDAGPPFPWGGPAFAE